MKELGSTLSLKVPGQNADGAVPGLEALMTNFGSLFATRRGAVVVRAISAAACVWLAAELSADFLRWLAARGVPADSAAVTALLMICSAVASLYWAVNYVLYPLATAPADAVAECGVPVAAVAAPKTPERTAYERKQPDAGRSPERKPRRRRRGRGRSGNRSARGAAR